MHEAKPRCLAGKSARCAPPEKAFAFFEISPTDFLFFMEKAVSGGSRLPSADGRRGSERQSRYTQRHEVITTDTAIDTIALV